MPFGCEGSTDCSEASHRAVGRDHGCGKAIFERAPLRRFNTLGYSGREPMPQPADESRPGMPSHQVDDHLLGANHGPCRTGLTGGSGIEGIRHQAVGGWIDLRQ